MHRTPAARARGITRSFGDVVALDGVDLDVASGQIHGLVGPNGAGKTTLLGLLLGLAVADSGSLEILGTPAGRTLTVPDGVAGFVDRPALHPSLTARQNLSALASLRRYDAGGTAIYQLDVTADGRYVADGDGPKEVNGYFQVRAPIGDAPNPLWQFDGNVDLLTSTTKE
ncbi:ATP-binding cassette domain-containing protein [Planotetraspora phitsanulokensis]|nr:ATP-binding cassette domain-containing protein [Planotetraspora phitsanulokensis]